MYEKKYRGNEAVRELRFRQGQRNTDERRCMYDVIESNLSYNRASTINITVRTEENEVFRATKIRRSEHFPFIVPELVNESGDFLLITWLTYGSLLRLTNEVR